CYHEPDLLGTAGALVAMRDFLDEPFVVLYGDVVTDSSLEALAGTHARSGAVATLGYHELHDAAGKGVIELDAGGAVAAFAEKPERGPPGPALVNAGVCIVEPRAIDEIDGIAPDLAYD